MISGFTLVKNGTRFDYPFVESLRSMLPLVDELVVNVGRGDDQTLERLRALASGEPKLRLFESDWPAGGRGGEVLSQQTNLALDRCLGDWCVYLQADEILHEEDTAALRRALEEATARPEIEGLLFDYVHFYGSFDVVQESRGAYRREVRCVRRSSGARSVGDAQSFRRADGGKLRVARSGARVFHYGWVRTPEAMREKTFHFDQLYHGAASEEQKASFTPHTGENYRYKRIWGLRPFRGTHPAVMRERVSSRGWHWDLATSPFEWSWRDSKKVALDLFERATGVRLFEYRSYRLLE